MRCRNGCGRCRTQSPDARIITPGYFDVIGVPRGAANKAVIVA